MLLLGHEVVQPLPQVLKALPLNLHKMIVYLFERAKGFIYCNVQVSCYAPSAGLTVPT